ncbi:hypothetical protein T12_14419 [Trichinella patagoniensis]|uniref:Uncharacterized protein n=1 Tax=Trichinella patagoniensis TaxID=990121 RepID=A0A0V0WS59_9BILA|nr:hypothetical protein T12_14419 [Trichinella patagoniensis]
MNLEKLIKMAELLHLAWGIYYLKICADLNMLFLQ